MEDLFISFLNMSLTASYVIAVIILARLFLKKAPKAISYILWAVAGFRLAFPFSFESVFSLIPFKAHPIPQTAALGGNVSFSSSAGAALRAIGDAANGGLGTVTVYLGKTADGYPVTTKAYHSQVWLSFGSYLWVIGIAALLVYGVVSIVLLNCRLRGAVLTERNIYEAENLKTPFVLGFIRPRIYIPSGLSPEEKSYIILHEQTHIKRLDHVVKLAAFLILCVHWFNPFVWAAFLLMSADMEMSCDEKVLKKMGSKIKQAYSTSLLSLAAGRSFINGSPLAFGEGNIKGRIKNVLNFKKTAAWVIIVSILLVTGLSVGFAANRIDETKQDLSMLNIRNLASISYQHDELNVSRAPGRSKGFNISGRAVAEYLNSVNWTEKKMDSPLELAADIQIEWNEDQELQFYESEPLLAMVRMNEQRRYYTIGNDDYVKMLSLMGTASGPQSNTSQNSKSDQGPSPNASQQEALEPAAPEWSPEQSIDIIGIPELDYASDDIIIFHGYFGLFVYDLDSRQIIRSLDLKPLDCAAIQGDNYCEVTVSTDGNTVQLHRLSSENMYVYTVSDNTLRETAYERMDDRFGSSFIPIEDVVDTDYLGNYSYNAVKFDEGEYGYLYISDWTLGTLTYSRDDTVYKLFDMNTR